MTSFSKLLHFVTYLILVVYAIPFQITPHTPGFGLRTGKIVLLAPVEPNYDGDKMCAKYYGPWYRPHAILREQKYNMIKEGRWGRGRHTVEIYGTPYIHYPSINPARPEVPVEALYGEVFGPQMNGWRTNLWGCWLMCQDIRKSFEWVLSAKLDGKIMVRLKMSFGYQCPEGQISRLVKRQTMREPETPEQLQEAFKLLASLKSKVQLVNQNNYRLMMGGRTGTITSCECFTPTPEERIVAEELLKENKHKSIYREDSIFSRKRPGPEGQTTKQRSTEYKRPRKRKPVELPLNFKGKGKRTQRVRRPYNSPTEQFQPDATGTSSSHGSNAGEEQQREEAAEDLFDGLAFEDLFSDDDQPENQYEDVEFEDLFPEDSIFEDETVLEDEYIDLPDEDMAYEVPGTTTCSDFQSYPEFDVEWPFDSPDQEAPPPEDVDVQAAVLQLQASLFNFAGFEAWQGSGPGSTSSKPGP